MPPSNNKSRLEARINCAHNLLNNLNSPRHRRKVYSVQRDRAANWEILISPILWIRPARHLFQVLPSQLPGGRLTRFAELQALLDAPAWRRPYAAWVQK